MRLSIAFLMLLTASMLVAFAAAPPKPITPLINKLVDKLGDDDSDVRKAAIKKLEDLGEDQGDQVVTLLRRAAKKHTDIDVRLRANVIAAAIEKKLYGVIRTFKGHSGWIYRMAITPDGKKLITCGDYVHVWDIESGKELVKFAAGVWPWAVSVSPDSKHVLVAHNDRGVRLYELATGKQILNLVKHTNQVWVAAISPDGKLAVTGGMDLGIHVWDLKTGKLLRSFENVSDYPRCAVFTPDGKHIAIGHFQAGNYATSPALVRIWDVQTGKLVRSSALAHAAAITSIVLSPDGKTLATSSFDKTVRLWNAATLKEVKKLTVSNQGCDGVVFTRDGKRLLTTGWGSDRAVKLWDIASGKEVHRYEGHTASVINVALAPSGKRFVTAGADGLAVLWPLPR